jgi:hypothetical protein
MIKECANHQTRIIITKFADRRAYAAGDPYEQSVINGNILLNEGIGAMWDLICGLGTPTAFDNANAQIGVGDSSTAEAASQTDLQAATNKTWKAMESGYPQRSAQTVTFRSVFGSTEANYAWNEFSVRNGATADMNMNRKVSAQGTKASGQIWTVDVQITLS